MKRGAIVLCAGVGALLLSSKKRAVRMRSSSQDLPEPGPVKQPDQASPPTYGQDEGSTHDEIYPVNPLLNHIDPDGQAQLGMLYQIQPGDKPLEVCLEALFGARLTTNERAWQAAEDLLVRIECGPWNQALYAVPRLTPYGSRGGYFTRIEVSFEPIYSDNFDRIKNGLRPTATKGNAYAMIWIPMINNDAFDHDLTVTTRGMSYPDSDCRQGGSMIDPPDEIIDLGFAEVSSNEVGCPLPEGDFRRLIVQD